MTSPEFLEEPQAEKQPKEIERKFRVDALPVNLNDFEHVKIHQGYLVIGNDDSEVRLRDKDGSYTLTVKSKGTMTRGEHEVLIDPHQFSQLWPATEGKRIEKTRYTIPQDDRVIELDVYEDAEL
ncbi:MAG: adenylate cyclase, partial [Candidatus Saccharibacteria bacterium]|nr:adenylate cyclase [Candidatus Saccharibacteria bacterium]